MPGPRFKNKTFCPESVAHYAREYTGKILKLIEQMDSTQLNAACRIIEDTAKGGHRIFVAGNGGSAAISDHLCCDWTHGTHDEGHKPIRTQSLVCNTPVMTALANDFGYEQVFSIQLEMMANRGDLVVLISSSGNSPNVIKAAETAKKLGVKTLGFTGFTGGRLKELVDISLHVPFENYGLVEDAHQLLMHCFAQFIALRRNAG